MESSAYYEEVRKYLNEHDRFCVFNRMRLVKIADGFAEAEMEVSKDSVNGLNVVQGGAIYTLADFAFAGASNANPEGKRCIGMSSNITYLRPGSGEKLRAVARMVNRGRRTCLCDVEVLNGEDKLVAKASLTGFFLEAADTLGKEGSGSK